MAGQGKRLFVIVGVALSPLTTGCGLSPAAPASSPASTATPNARNAAQSASAAQPNHTITMPPIGPYHSVAGKHVQLPTELSAADVEALSPGTRALVTDYKRAKLSPYTFCVYSLDLLGSISGVPPRYRAAVLATNDKIALFVTMQAAQKRLTPDQTARLTSQFLRVVAVH